MELRETLPACRAEPDLYQARVVWEDGCGDWMNINAREAETLRGVRYKNHYEVRELVAITSGEAGTPARDSLAALEGALESGATHGMVTRIAGAVPENDRLHQLADGSAEALVSDAEMNVMLEHFDTSSGDGAKRFALHCVELACGRLSGQIALP